MNRKELKTAKDSDVIVDYIRSFSSLVVNMHLGRGTKALAKHLLDLDKEMLKRGILTQEQVDHLNS